MPYQNETNMKKYQLDIELFQGYMCTGIPVTEDLSFEVEFSDEDDQNYICFIPDEFNS